MEELREPVTNAFLWLSSKTESNYWHNQTLKYILLIMLMKFLIVPLQRTGSMHLPNSISLKLQLATLSFYQTSNKLELLFTTHQTN